MQCLGAGLKGFAYMFKSPTIKELTQQTIDATQKQIDDINSKIAHIQTERMEADTQFQRIKQRCRGYPDTREKSDMKSLLLKRRNCDDSLDILDKQLASMNMELTRLRGFVFTTEVTQTSSEIQKNIEKITNHYNPQRMHAAMDKRDDTMERLDTFKREIEDRLGGSMTSEMDVDAELDKELNLQHDCDMIEMPTLQRKGSASSSVYANRPPVYAKQAALLERQSLLRNGHPSDAVDDLYGNLY